LILFSMLLLGYSATELWANMELSWNATVYALLLCLPMFITLFFVVRSQWEPLFRLRKEFEEKVLPIFSNCKLIDLAVISLFAGVGEELFFRGWMQAVLIDRSGMWLGILITSAIFGFLHYLSTTYAIYAFLTGIYLGLIYQVFGNLYIVMVIHAVYDFIALVYLVGKGGSKETMFRAIGK